MSPVKSPEKHSSRDVGKKNEIVVENNEADELPPGWIQDLKTRKTGSGSATRVDRYYTDPVTGYIFRSLKDVQRYLKTGELGRLAIKPKNDKCVDMDNKYERIHMEEIEERSESKELMSETLSRKRLVDKTSSKFSETGESKLPRRASKRLTPPSPSPSQEPKTRQATRLAGIKVDSPSLSVAVPPGGHEMSLVMSPEQHSAWDVEKTNKMVLENDEVDELPPGWTKEEKTRKSGSRTKVDRYYTDPVTGYIFHSLKDVQRYLKTGKLGRLASKPKNNEDERLHMEEREERSALKEHMSESLRLKRPVGKTISKVSEMSESELLHRASKRLAPPSPPPPEPKTRQATRQAGLVVDSPPLTPLPIEYKIRQPTHVAEVVVDAPLSSPSPVEPKTRNATRKSGIKINSPPPSPPDTRTNRLATHQDEIKIDASLTPPPPAPKTRQAAQQSEVKIVSPSPPSQASRTCQAKRTSNIRDNASLPHPKTRRATRQADIKIDSPPPSPPNSRNSRQATRSILVHLATPKRNYKKIDASNEIADMDSKSIHNQDTSVIIPPVNQENHGNPKEHNKEIEMGPTPPISVVPTVNFAKQELPVINPTVSTPINFSMNDLWTDPCIDFAVKTLTGAIPCGDMNKPENPSPSPLKVPLEELWTDPCIEFAVKTLTGAIPIGEDYLQHQPAPSCNTRGPHDFYLPDVGTSFCQTDVLSKRFETGQNNKQQQDSTFVNVGFQKSGNFVNGQCSRSRFF